MNITLFMKKYYSQSLEEIQNCVNRKEKRNLIKELICNLKKASISFSERKLSNSLSVSRQLIHSIILETEVKKKCFFSLFLITVFCLIFGKETRGRKKFEITHPKIIQDIEEICRNTLHVDKSLKDEIIYHDVTLTNVRKELNKKYGYVDKNLPTEKTISRIMKECLGYKITKVKKDKVFKRIKETDIIFNNVFKKMSEIKTNKNILAISIDDKVAKYIGKLSALGYSWLARHAFDHDTSPEYIVKPFGIMDIKEKIVHVFCTISNSTANFKVDCIEKFIAKKLIVNPLINKIVIFLDNGPENSSRRKLWMKRIIELAIKYKITVELVYYPPYHSKYNLIEHFWGVLQKHWSGLIIDTLDKLIGAINSTTWNGNNAIGYLCKKEYPKGEDVDLKYLNKLIANHVQYPNDDIKKWSLLITP